MSDRYALGFSETVIRDFRYLTQQGFMIIKINSTYVEYYHDGISISIYHGRRSYKLGLEVGFEDDINRLRLSINDLLKFFNPNKNEFQFTAVNKSSVLTGVARMALVFKQILKCQNIFDITMLKQASESKKTRLKAYWDGEKRKDALYKAEVFWFAKDFCSFVNALSSLECSLSDLNRRKLAYARKHCDSSQK